MTEEVPTIDVGQTIPDSSIQIKSEEGVDSIETADYFRDCRVVMITVPGAFTRTCSAKHLPGFVNNADKFKVAGFDKIACLAVNDAHVMRAWGLDNDADGIIDMVADPFAEFSDALGLTRFMGPILGRRATRCTMIIENGVLTKMFMEEPAAFEVSSAEHVLANI